MLDNDFLQKALVDVGICTLCLEGKMSYSQRRMVLSSFNTTIGATVLLISTKSGGVGLTLVEASRVYMMDLW